MKLKTLTAKVVAVHTADTVSNGPGFTATAKGLFLIVTLNVTNVTSSVQTFGDVGQTQSLLYVGGSTYTESFEAENTNDPNSFVANDNGIQSGESQTGDLVYDLPPAKAQAVTTNARAGVFIANFGDDLSQGVPGKVGFITLKGL